MENTGERYLPDISGLNESGIEHIQRYLFALQNAKNKIVVDIASGEGYGSDMMADVAQCVVGVDISIQAVNHANAKYKKANLSFIQGSIDNLPFDDSSVDMVVSFETIEHVVEEVQHKFIKEAHRILKDDGIFLISTPNKAGLEHYRLSSDFHVKELYLDEFKNCLKNEFKYVTLYKQFHESACFLISDGTKKDNPYTKLTGTEYRSNDELFVVAVASNVKQSDWECFVSLSSEPYANRKAFLYYRDQAEYLQQKSNTLQQNAIKYFFKKNPHIYIYGAGDKAAIVADYLRVMGIDYIGHIVSNNKQKPNKYMSHPVFYLNEVNFDNSNIGVILGLNSNNRDEVAPLLSKAGIEDIYYFE